MADITPVIMFLLYRSPTYARVRRVALEVVPAMIERSRILMWELQVGHGWLILLVDAVVSWLVWLFVGR